MDGHLNVLQLLSEKWPVGYDACCIMDALQSGNVDVYDRRDHSDWVSSQPRLVQYATQRGHRQVLKWLHEHVGLFSSWMESWSLGPWMSFGICLQRTHPAAASGGIRNDS